MPLFHPDILRQQIKAMLFYYGALPLLVLGPGFLLERVLPLPRLPGGIAVWPSGRYPSNSPRDGAMSRR